MPTPPLKFKNRYDGLDCFLPFPGFARFRCTNHGPDGDRYHDVNVSRGSLTLAAFQGGPDVLFELRAEPNFSSRWVFAPSPTRDMASTRKRAAEVQQAIIENGGSLGAMIFGPFPCRSHTFTMRSWRVLPPASCDCQDEDEYLASEVLIKMLLARRELESNIAKAEAAYEAAVAARQESEWFKLDCQIKEESKRLAALNDEIEAIGQHLGSRPARQNAEEPSIFRDR